MEAGGAAFAFQTANAVAALQLVVFTADAEENDRPGVLAPFRIAAFALVGRVQCSRGKSTTVDEAVAFSAEQRVRVAAQARRATGALAALLLAGDATRFAIAHRPGDWRSADVANLASVVRIHRFIVEVFVIDQAAARLADLLHPAALSVRAAEATATHLSDAARHVRARRPAKRIEHGVAEFATILRIDSEFVPLVCSDLASARLAHAEHATTVAVAAGAAAAHAIVATGEIVGPHGPVERIRFLVAVLARV